MINVSGDKSGLVQCKELDDGKVNIFLGDCLDVMENMDDNSVDMIMFDAPFYQNRFKFNKDNKIQKYIEWIELVCKQFNRLLKDGGNICYINAPKYIYHTAGIFFKYFQYRNDIPLIRKGSFRPAYMLGFQHNLLMMFYKGDLKAKWGGATDNHDRNFPTDVWDDITYRNGYRGKGKDNWHPEAIGIDLTSRCIQLNSIKGDVVLDCCSGSMTTAVASINLGRRCVCIEKDEHYYKIGTNRVNEHLQERLTDMFGFD